MSYFSIYRLSLHDALPIFNTITVTLVSGAAQSVTLSVSGLPTGATAGFSGGVGCGNQPTCTGTQDPTIAVKSPTMTSCSISSGSSNVTVKWTGGRITHNTS